MADKQLPGAAGRAPEVIMGRQLAGSRIGIVGLTVLLALFWPRQRQSASARLRALNKAEES